MHFHLAWQIFGKFSFMLEEVVACLGGDGESGRHWQSDLCHLGEAGSFAAEDFFHLPITFRFSGPEKINVFHPSLFSACFTGSPRIRRLNSVGAPTIASSSQILNCYFSIHFSSGTMIEKSAIVENSFRNIARSPSRFL